MIRKKYTIEASVLTLARFATAAAVHGGSAAFIERVTPDKNQEYYYVVVIADKAVHQFLHSSRFTTSILLPEQP